MGLDDLKRKKEEEQERKENFVKYHEQFINK